MAHVHVGIGGWNFPPWRGTFYPEKLPQAQELAYASRHVTSIEINATFYGSQKPASFIRWRQETPDDFVFSIKGPRYATHRRDLAEADESIERFFNSGVLELEEKLGPVLWQFPPTRQFDADSMRPFLERLPATRDGVGHTSGRSRSGRSATSTALPSAAVTSGDPSAVVVTAYSPGPACWTSRVSGAGARPGCRRPVVTSYARRSRSSAIGVVGAGLPSIRRTNASRMR